mgnify:CR=1 FL=1
MQFPISVKIEPSQSGKTFGVALVKDDKVLLVVKGCKLANGSNGQFVSGPSAKMDNGEWFRYLYMDKQFGDYVTKLAIEAMPKEPQQSKPKAASLESDIPFN